MSNYRWWITLIIMFSTNALLICTANAEAIQPAESNKNEASSPAKMKSGRIKKAPSRELVEIEARAKAENAAKESARAIQESQARAAQEAKARAAAEAEAKAKREAQIAARQKLLATAAALSKAGKPADAYALLAPYQSQLAGDTNYDYLLGIVALDSGKPNEAIFALERVLAVNPNHLQARAEIARAYLATGELAASKQEFETVQQQNPPREVSATIQKYLDIIETDRSAKATSMRAYIEAIVGDDSNANSATSSSQIAIPAFGGTLMNLNASGVAKHDSFGGFAGGLNVRHALNPEWVVIGGANYNQRNNSTLHSFDTANTDANLGVSRTRGNDSHSVALQAQNFSLDSKSYRDAYGMTGQWQRNLDSGSQSSLYLQYTNLTYPTQTYRNADRYVLGGAYAMSLSGEYTPVMYFGAYAGTESTRKGGYSYLSNNLYGIRAGGEMKLTPLTTFLASVSVESRTYNGNDPLFLKAREDMQTDLRLALGYVPAQNWTVTPSLSYTNNGSNIAIYKYERTMFSISARRDFN